MQLKQIKNLIPFTIRIYIRNNLTLTDNFFYFKGKPKSHLLFYYLYQKKKKLILTQILDFLYALRYSTGPAN